MNELFANLLRRLEPAAVCLVVLALIRASIAFNWDSGMLELDFIFWKIGEISSTPISSKV